MSRKTVKMINQAQSGGAPDATGDDDIKQLVELFQNQLDIRELIMDKIKNSSYIELARLANVSQDFVKNYKEKVINPIVAITTARELINYLLNNPMADSLYNFEKSNVLTMFLNAKLDDIIEQLLVVFPTVRNVTVAAMLQNNDEIRNSHMYNTQQYPIGSDYNIQSDNVFTPVHGYTTAYEAWEALWILRHLKFISFRISGYVTDPYERGYTAETQLKPSIVPLNTLNKLIQNLQAIPPRVKVTKRM